MRAKPAARRVSPRFFFSSRRRHTRCLSDWSSDVCSSDLSVVYTALDTKLQRKVAIKRLRDPRSEERRVGKECRSRWALDHEKKKALKQDRHTGRSRP